MAQIIIPPREGQSLPSYCSCSAPSPTYTPKFESLSDTDLDILEIAGLVGSLTPMPADLTCDMILSGIRDYIDCWTCIRPRRRRELVVSKLGNPADNGMTASDVRNLLRLFERCLTPDQIKAILDLARYTYYTPS